MADYRAAGDSPRLTAKLADAALQGGLLAESAQAWTKLGTDAPEQAAEAAAGLARVADIAEHDGKLPVLAQAIAGLHRIAPSWPLGRVASRLGDVTVVPAAMVPDVVPAMLVTAVGPDASSSLLLALAQADRSRGACEPAVSVLEDVLRRSTNAGLRDTATTSLGWCELGLGLMALQSARAADAERWLDRAVGREPQSATGRRAQVALGDARLRQGDTVAARGVWEGLANSAAPPDSITQLALSRLVALTPTLPDSGTLHPVRP
jgi:hypothetical protein